MPSAEYAPHVDLLTGAWKRDHFLVELAAAVSRAHRSKRPLALLRLDVDNLQEHNDMHGQATLDAALGWLAAKVSQLVDGAGPIGRVGGDELAVFLEDCSVEKARRLAEALRRAVPRTLHASAFGDYRLTVSVGVAALRRGEPWGNFFEAAEAACIKAKQGGRDTVATR